MTDAKCGSFLGVDSSYSGLAWRSRLQPDDERIALEIAQKHHLPDIVARVLAARNVASTQVAEFLQPSLKHLMPDPDILQDMIKAVKRIALAIAKNQEIAVFGDYDVDGACSSALIIRYLRELGHDKIRLYIPDRLKEGYGPNCAAITQLKEQGSDLMITVDCGATSFEALDLAAQCGLEVIVIDHHVMSDELPRAVAVVNPNRPDDLSDLGYLAGVGVAFMVLVGLNRYLRHDKISTQLPDLLRLLDLVALGTVCDIVPLKGVNRAFVAKGLQVLAMRTNAGLAALGDVAKLKEAPNPSSLGFVLGPRLNAGGRIGNSILACNLLCCDNYEQAIPLAQELDVLNQQRREIEASTLTQAESLLTTHHGDDAPATIILANPDWHPGLVGLVAAKLVRTFNRPAIIGATAKQVITASARSIKNVDITKAIYKTKELGLAIKGGGHAMAGGVSVAVDRWQEFCDKINDLLAIPVAKARERRVLDIDGCLALGALNVNLIELLNKAGPYGAGQPAPVIALAAQRVSYVREVGVNHIRLGIANKGGKNSQVAAMAFGAKDTALGKALIGSVAKFPVHLAVALEINNWGGVSKPQLRIIDACDV